MIDLDSCHIWISLQLCDSSFPGGSFSHSGGLESVVSHGLVSRSSESFVSFLSLYLEQCLNQMLPIISLSHQACNGSSFQENHFNEFLKADHLCHSIITNNVSRRASINQGKCLLRASIETFSTKYPRIMELYVAINSVLNSKTEFRFVYSHYASTFGAVCGLLQLPLILTNRLFMRCILRDLVSAAHRLNVVGPLEGSRIQAEYGDIIESMIQQHVLLEKEHQENNMSLEPVQTCPILELMQASHDNLYSRLFNS